MCWISGAGCARDVSNRDSFGGFRGKSVSNEIGFGTFKMRERLEREQPRRFQGRHRPVRSRVCCCVGCLTRVSFETSARLGSSKHGFLERERFWRPRKGGRLERDRLERAEDASSGSALGDVGARTSRLGTSLPWVCRGSDVDLVRCGGRRPRSLARHARISEAGALSEVPGAMRLRTRSASRT